ncbi:hypothetical protein AB0M36_20280 [Actinoplanes sp. NPDC051346]|uniref:hypothetical protein n=1 Tax=Actinoplanes sp. NPDC051346 TaxID=3155048 RepID=UPI00344864E5
MITRFLAAAGRRRRVILVVALVVSAGYLVAHVWVPTLGQRTFPVTAAVPAVFLMLAIVALAGARPKAFRVDPRVPAFSASAQPTLLFLALAFFPTAIGIAGNVIRDWSSEPFLAEHLLELGYPAVLSMWIVLAWRDTNVRLRPDGVWQRGITGWLVIPWDAVPIVPTLPPSPTARTVRLAFGRPELVHRRGLHVYRNCLRTDDIDPRFLCAAIRYYLAHPQHRTAIGTQAEHDRVLPLLLNSLHWSPPDQGKPDQGTPGQGTLNQGKMSV